MSVEIITFGCRLNAFESEVMAREAENAGLSDTVIINSCAVTNEAVAQARQSIRRIKRERPGARIVVTGCAAQTQAEMFAGMAEVDRVVGNNDKMQSHAWLAARTALDGGAASAGWIAKGATARFRASTERLRSPLHLLHHSLRPRQFALDAGGGCGRASPLPGRTRSLRDRADRRRSDKLRRRSAGCAQARSVDERDFAGGSRAEAVSDL